LPVDPTDTFPLEAIKQIAGAEKFDARPYSIGVGDFEITLMTPTLKYRMQTAADREAARTKEKRNNKSGAVQATFRPFEEFRGWMEYVGEYKPVLQIRAMSELGESFWSALNRGLAANSGVTAQAQMRFKADFFRMRLLCGGQEIEPIHPAKIAHVVNRNTALVSLNDATYEGFYTYPANAISPNCGQVTLEIFSEKSPEKPSVKVLDRKTVQRIADDFSPYFRSR
jgi:hypothetical protein